MNIKRYLKSDSFLSLSASIICIIVGLVIGAVVLFCIDPSAFLNDGLKRILMGGFYMKPMGIGREIANAAPLIMTGLSVAFAFKTGLFNIGAAGQYTLGAFGAILAAIVFGWPWWLCLIVATVFGALWGAIPGIFKAYLNINEVITAIMFNWIGLYMVNTIMYGNGVSPMYDTNKAKTYSLRSVFPDSVIPDFGIAKIFKNDSTTIAIILAIIVAILIYIVVNKTTFGFELKACGYNKNAAKYAGINEKKSIILSMFIAGGLAGFGAGLYYLSSVAEWNPLASTALPAMGFNGISVALLASSNPIGCIFSALLISHITTGGSFMNANIFPIEIANIVTGVIIYLCAFTSLFKGRIVEFMKKRIDKQAEVKPELPAEQKEKTPAEETEEGKESEE